MDQPQALAGRLALVTGASRGIGREVATALARAGARLILVSRTTGALEELDDELQALGAEPATLAPMDLCDFPAIDRLGGVIAERWGKLDILVGNAGVLGGLGPVAQMTPKDWEQVMAVNLTANWRLLRAFDPLLRMSDAGRALFLTSSVAHKVKPYWGGYSAAKAALEKLVQVYAVEVGKITPVRANLLDPGPTRTRMRAEAMPGEDPDTLPHPKELVPLVLDLVSPRELGNGQIFTVSRRDSPRP